MAGENPIFDLFYKEKLRHARVLAESEVTRETDPYVITAPANTREIFAAGLRSGVAQIEGDIDRFSAIGNLLIGDKEAAQVRLNKAALRDQEAAATTANIATFEDLVNEPSLANLWEQAVVQTAKFTPQAITSIAAGGGGYVAGLLARYGVRKAGLAASREITEELLRKKLAGATLDEAENALLRSVAAAAKIPGRGAIAGAFGQEYVMGSAQSLSEYQEAGIELTQHEAMMASILGVPQAALGTLGEVFFAKTLVKQALKRSALGQTLNKATKGQKLTAEQNRIFQLFEKRRVGQRLTAAEMMELGKAAGRGTFVGALVTDIARGIGQSALVEGVTETAQESLQIAQRFAIDDDYTAAQAKLRIGEAAFAGTVAGSARGGAGSAIGSIFNQAKDQVEQGFERRYRAEARAQQYGAGRDIIPETQEQLDAQAAAVEDPGIDKDTVWVPNRTDGKEPLVPTFADIDNVIMIKTPTGVLYTTNKAKAEVLDSEFGSEGPTEEQLRDMLGYTAVKDESHDRVIRIRNKDGQIVFEQTTNEGGAREAIRNANRIVKDKGAGYVVESEMLEQAVRERNMDNMGDNLSEMGDSETDDAGVQGVTATEADVQQTEGMEAQEGAAGAEDYVRNDDGEVTLWKASGKASDENKQAFLATLTTREQAYWTDPKSPQDRSRRIDSLSDSVIKRYLTEIKNPGDVYLTDQVAPGFYAIARSGVAEAPAVDAKEVLQDAKTTAKQTAFKLSDNRLKGWQLVETDAEGNTTTSDVNIQDLSIAGRTLSEQGDSDASFGQQIVRGFGALLAALADEGSSLTYNGKPVNDQVMATAPVFFQGGKTYTLNQLSRLPRTLPAQESAQELEDSITEVGNYTSEDLVN